MDASTGGIAIDPRPLLLALPPPSPCPLVNNLPTVLQDQLLALLSLRDLVVLLATCKGLRVDREFVAKILHTNQHTRHLYQKCRSDSTPVVPRFHSNGACPSQHTDHDPWAEPSRLLSQEQRVALLSVAGLMATGTLPSIWYAELDDEWYTVPFIRPLRLQGSATAEELRAALEARKEGLGDAFFTEETYISRPGLHWDNFYSDKEQGNVKVACRFCETIKEEIAVYKGEGYAYWASREEDLEKLQNEWRGEGYDSDSEEYQAREQAFDDARHEQDEFYDEDALMEDLPEEEAFLLMNHGRLSHHELHLLEAAHQMCDRIFLYAASACFMDDFCTAVFRPLKELFMKSGFQHVRRAKMPFYRTHPNLPDELHTVEMAGGLTPHGFFVGFYILKVQAYGQCESHQH